MTAQLRAFNLLRDVPHYRRDAFDAGLRAIGYDVVHQISGSPQPRDVLVIWNRYGEWDQYAVRFETVGAAVLVAENGYIGASENAYAKPFVSLKQEPESQLYALALSYHNGAGQWWIGAPGRWRQQGIEVKPWRKGGGHILVLPQRGIGPTGVAMPQAWPQAVVQRLQAITRRPVRVRGHPGNAPAQRPLQADLEGVWCAVTWGSGAAIKAICTGVPAFNDLEHWIGASACRPLSGGFIENPLTSDLARERMLDRLAWAQWTVDELSTGEPFARLLELHQMRQRAA